MTSIDDDKITDDKITDKKLSEATTDELLIVVAKKVSRSLRLTENNPTMQKLTKLCELADELGISITFHQGGVCVVDNDRDDSLPDLYLEDIEPGHHVNNFPPCTEYKLIYDNPEYLVQQSREYYERRAREAAADAEKAAKAKAKAKAKAARRAAELEVSERHVLATLKAKYPDA